MSIYPTPHLDKLKATAVNDKLPPEDKSQVERAIEHYEQWIANTDITSAFLSYIRQLLQHEPLDEQSVLERGYF